MDASRSQKFDVDVGEVAADDMDGQGRSRVRHFAATWTNTKLEDEKLLYFSYRVQIKNKTGPLDLGLRKQELASNYIALV